MQTKQNPIDVPDSLAKTLPVQRLDPETYIRAGGWGWDEICSTAEYGISDEDVTRIRDYYTRTGCPAGMHGHAVNASAQAIIRYCEQRAAEYYAAS